MFIMRLLLHRNIPDLYVRLPISPPKQVWGRFPTEPIKYYHYEQPSRAYKILHSTSSQTPTLQ